MSEREEAEKYVERFENTPSLQSWSFTGLWNESVISSNRPVEPRDYCWASEIGQPLVDRWLKMKGIQPTNAPNMRSLRKFEAGNLVEWIVRFVLERAGLIQECQERVYVEYDGLLKVSGKLDFKAGGMPDFDKARHNIEHMNLPRSIADSSLYMVQHLTTQFGGKPLKEIVIEIKSCSTFVMDAMEKTNKPISNHKFQAFHYIKGLGMDEAHLCYVCKDDLRMAEFPVFNPSRTELEYVADLKAITGYYNNNERPPLEPLVKWKHEEGKFSKSLGIEYSNYLTMLYGFETPREYSDSVGPMVARWNRVLNRYAADENITAKNKEVREEIVRAGYDFDELVYTKKEIGITEEEESTQ